jgi:hypothetical protein
MTTNFSFTDDMLDVRDLIERFEELETKKEEMLENVPASKFGNRRNKLWKAWEDSDEYTELKQLEDILEEMVGMNNGEAIGIQLL